jgi:hypothetical protein
MQSRPLIDVRRVMTHEAPQTMTLTATERKPLPDSVRALIVAVAAALVVLAATASVVIHRHTHRYPTHYTSAYAGR